MSLKDCIAQAVRGGEMAREDGERLVKRLDELSARGLSPEDIRQQMIRDVDADTIKAHAKVFDRLLDEGRPPADAKRQIITDMTWRGVSRETIDLVDAGLDAHLIKARAAERKREEATYQSARGHLDNAFRRGKVGRAAPHVPQAVHDAIRSMIEDIVPADIRVGALTRVEPTGDPLIARAVFVTADGAEFWVEKAWSALRNNRAAYWPSLKAIGLFTLTRPTAKSALGRFRHRLRSKLAHELLHAFRDLGAIGDDAWARLVDHAIHRLHILDLDLATYFRLIERLDLGFVRGTLRGTYDDIYHTRARKAQLIEEEAVAHLVELIIHGALLPSQYRAVAPLLAPLFDGSQGRISRQLTGSMSEAQVRALARRWEGADITDVSDGGPRFAIDKESQDAVPLLTGEASQLRTEVPGGGRASAGGEREARGAGQVGDVGARDVGDAGRASGPAGTERRTFEISGYVGRVVPGRPKDGLRSAKFFVFREDEAPPARASAAEQVRAHGRAIAHMDLTQRGPDRWEVLGVKVNPGLRRQGLATRLYDAVEAHLGAELRPSGVLTDDGHALWRKRNPELVKYHQRVGDSWFSPKQLLNMKAGLEHIASFTEDVAEIRAAARTNEQINRALERVPAEAFDDDIYDAMFAVTDGDAPPPPPPRPKDPRLAGRAEPRHAILAPIPEDVARANLAWAEAFKAQERKFQAILDAGNPITAQFSAAERARVIAETLTACRN